MTKETDKQRTILGRILLGISAFTSVMSIVYIIKFMFFGNSFVGFMTAFAFAFTMLYGAFLGVGMNYTIRVPRGKDDDFSQIVAGIIMIILGTVICASMQINFGIGEYIILPIVFYIQNFLMLVIAGIAAAKFYKK